MNLCDILAAHARAKPDFTAIVEKGHELTYAALTDRILRMAGHLRARGVVEGDRVALCLKDHSEHLVAIFAVARLGAAMLPMDWRSPPAEREALARRFNVKITLVDPRTRYSDSVPHIVIDDAWRTAIEATSPHEPYGDYWSVPAIIMMTSGSTGRSKGALLTHGQQFARFVSAQRDLPFDSGSRHLSFLPLCFSAGRTLCLLHLLAGNTVILHLPIFDADALISATMASRATTTLVVPTVLRWLLAMPEKEAPILGALDSLICTGGGISAHEKQAAQRQINANFHDLYGASGGGLITVLGPDDMSQPESVGRPVFGMQIDVVDEAGQPMALGERGLLRCRGPGVASGFYDEAGQGDVESFRDGWYYSGEIVSIDPTGLVYLHGRSTDLIIHNGINIFPQEVEETLMAHDCVSEAAVVGEPSVEAGENLVAFVVTDGELDIDTLRIHCRINLANYKRPYRFIVVDSLPKTAVGKVSKGELRAQLGAPEKAP